MDLPAWIIIRKGWSTAIAREAHNRHSKRDGKDGEKDESHCETR